MSGTDIQSVESAPDYIHKFIHMNMTEMMLEIIQKESLQDLKKNIPADKKLFFVMDQDINSVFLLFL